MNLLLPIVQITVVGDKLEKTFNCLLDSDSQRSYLSDGVLDILHCHSVPMKKKKKKKKKESIIKTFLGSAKRSLNELELCVKLPNFECSVPFLFDEYLDLQFHVKGLSAAVRNIITGGSKLAVDFSCVRNDCLSGHGLVGAVVLKYMGPMQLIYLMKGSAFEFTQGIVLFSNVTDFLYPIIDVTNSDVSSINYCQAVADYSQRLVTHLYFVLDPKSNYFDPFDSFTLV